MRSWVPLAVLPWILATPVLAAPEAGSEMLVLRRAIPLPKVEGRIDHLAIDPEGKRLVVAALGNNTVEVVDLEKGAVVRSLTGIEEPQGVAILPATGQIAVTSGGDGSLRIFDGKTFDLASRVALGEDADNLRVESDTGRLVAGFGAGGLALVSPGKAPTSVRLSAHPESFQLESAGTRVFVNVPGAGHVAVVDRAAGKVVATWPVKEALQNFPMAFDEAHQRLLVGCRAPARLLVLDASAGAPEPGRLVASLEISGDVDDVWEDRARRRFYLTCGAGFVDVVDQVDADRYARTARIPSAAGARTSLFVASTSTLYVAVPHRGTQAAEIREYVAKP